MRLAGRLRQVGRMVPIGNLQLRASTRPRVKPTGSRAPIHDMTKAPEAKWPLKKTNVTNRHNTGIPDGVMDLLAVRGFRSAEVNGQIRPPAVRDGDAGMESLRVSTKLRTVTSSICAGAAGWGLLSRGGGCETSGNRG